jgi:hypothetical protein
MEELSGGLNWEGTYVYLCSKHLDAHRSDVPRPKLKK